MIDRGWYRCVGLNKKQYITKVMTYRMGLHLVCVYVSTNLVGGIHFCKRNIQIFLYQYCKRAKCDFYILLVGVRKASKIS